MTRSRALGLAFLALGVGVGAALGEFVTIGAAPCDPTAPVLSDGTRQAPGNWGTAWAVLTLLAAGNLALAAGLHRRYVSDAPITNGKVVGLASGVGVASLTVLWIAGAIYWGKQCPGNF